MTTLSSSGKEALDNFIKEASTGDKPGIVFGVCNLDDEIYFQGGGTNVFGDESSGDVNPESVFMVCSQTKLIVALAALKLIDQGKLAFDTVVSDYFPEFLNPVIVDRDEKKNSQPAKTAITVQHLLNFTSGLFYGDDDPTLSSQPAGYTSKTFLAAQDPISEFFRVITGDYPGLPLRFEPGTDFAYGWSSDILGFLVEKVSGKSLEEFCKEHIFIPLGMQSSFYLTPSLKQKLVQLAFRDSSGKYNHWDNQGELFEQDPSKLRLCFGGIGLYSSMRDYLKLLRHILLIEVGRPVENPILKKETVHTTFLPALTEAGSKSVSKLFMTEGLQWGTAQAITMKDEQNRRKKGSAFWGGWAGTMHFLDPSTGIAAVFGVQVCPPPDINHYLASLQLETILYSGLERGQGANTT